MKKLMQMSALSRIFKRSKDKVTAFGITDVGQQAYHNEDYCLLMPQKSIYIVADGMGGHKAGDVASMSAVKAISKYFTHEVTARMRSDVQVIREEMINAVREASAVPFTFMTPSIKSPLLCLNAGC